VTDSSKSDDEDDSPVKRAKETVALMFPDEPSHLIESILNRNSFDVEASIDEILRYKESCSTSNHTNDANLSRLCEIFEGESISLLTSALKDANGSLDGAIQAISSKDDALKAKACDGSCIEMGFPCFQHSGLFESGRGKTAMSKLSKGTRKFLVSSNLTGSPSLISQSSEDGDGKKDLVKDPQAARDAATHIASERAILFHKAANAFSRKERGTASFFADEVH
jgi:hypothetical protein